MSHKSIIWLRRTLRFTSNLAFMTTNKVIDEEVSINSFLIEHFCSENDADWKHPLLEIFRPKPTLTEGQRLKLYLVPSRFDDEYDPDFAPEPTSAQDLPNLTQWVERFICNVVEIWAGRRSPGQLSNQCHHRIFSELVRKSGSQKQVGHVRKIHIQEPLDGICEATVTVRFENRLRSVMLRFEGVDKRWLCTALTLL